MQSFAKIGIAVLLLSYAINAMDRALFPMMLTDVRREYVFTLPQAGLMSTVFTLGMALAGVPTGYLVDAMGGGGCLDYRIKPLVQSSEVMVGTAVTCHAGPADNLALFGALHAAKAGDILVAATDAFMGCSITGDLLLGWDTDQFPTDVYLTTQCMMEILGQGGLAPGGVNFDAKVRRESFEPVDLFYAHVGGMDAFAKGLKIAAKIRADGVFDKAIEKRYA